MCCVQLPGVPARQDVQRNDPDRAGPAQVALLHRPRRRHVPAHPQLLAQQEAPAARRLLRNRPAHARGAILRFEQ